MDSAGQFLEGGDLIEFRDESYSHWGIFDGLGFVIHVTGDGADGQSRKDGQSCKNIIAASLGFVDAYVRNERLPIVAGGRKFYVNNELDEVHYPRNVEDILREASWFIDMKWDYNLLSSNCEHFASMMRYGTAVSLQVVEATNLAKKVAAAAAACSGVGSAGILASFRIARATR